MKLSCPVVCPKCGTELLRGIAIFIQNAGFDVYCPYCKTWSHIKDKKEKRRKRKE